MEGSGLTTVEDPLVHPNPLEAGAAFTFAALLRSYVFQRSGAQYFIDSQHLISSLSCLNNPAFLNGRGALFARANDPPAGLGTGLCCDGFKTIILVFIGHCFARLTLDTFRAVKRWLHFLILGGGHV